jgi:heavy metal sensor kinase
MQTPNQPLDSATLFSLGAQVARNGQAVWIDVMDSRHVPRRVYAMPLTTSTNSLQTLVVSRSVAEMLDEQQRTFVIVVAVSAGLLLIGGALSYWLAGRALRPVRTIAAMARSISERDLNRRIDVKVPPDELGELVDTFNSMLARLEAGFTSMSTFTANASHELRAPLALMRSEVDGALSRSRSPEEYKRVLESLRQEVEHLTRLSDQLLILARADAGALLPAPEPVDVADFLHETAARWGKVAKQHGSRVEVSAPANGRMQADPALLRRVVDNLIDNAIRHTPRGAPVTLRGYPANGGWNVEVADQGPGVASNQRDKLFTRFARADRARSRDGGGAGLGLALSAAIARAHGGTLELVNQPGPGAVFQLHLPQANGHISHPGSSFRKPLDAGH